MIQVMKQKACKGKCLKYVLYFSSLEACAERISCTMYRILHNQDHHNRGCYKWLHLVVYNSLLYDTMVVVMLDWCCWYWPTTTAAAAPVTGLCYWFTISAPDKHCFLHNKPSMKHKFFRNFYNFFIYAVISSTLFILSLLHFRINQINIVVSSSDAYFLSLDLSNRGN